MFPRRDEADVRALSDISLSIKKGEFVAITGPSGSGKSTLLNLLGCLDRLTRGVYRLFNEDVAALSHEALAHVRRTKIGFVFQEYNLIEDATALENIELPAVYSGVDQRSRRHRALSLLDFVGLSNRVDHKAVTLSGGEQQRVAIARALMNGARVLLADEPTGSLDQENTHIVISLLRNLVSRGWTVIIVTHDWSVAERTNRVIQLRQGRLISDQVNEARDRTRANKEVLQILGESQVSIERRLPLASTVGTLVTTLRFPLRTVLSTHRVRTIFSSLSVAVALWSVTTLVAIMNANYQQTLETLAKIGGGAVEIRPAMKTQSDDPEPVELTVEDATALKQVDNVLYSMPVIRFKALMRYRDRKMNADFVATNAKFTEINDLRTKRGSRFSLHDESSRARVVVLGARAAKELFPNWRDPTGQVVMIDEQLFVVKAVLESSNVVSDALEDSRDAANYMPLSTAQLYFRNSDSVDAIALYTVDPTHVDGIVTGAAQILRQRHGGRGFIPLLGIGERVGFYRLRKIMPLLIATVGVLSLVLGGIGVMSVMFIAVQRRIREIGIRISCGARRRDILVQFLTEAVVITGFGGVVGLIAGASTLLILLLLEFPVSVPAFLWAGSSVSIFFIGVVVGIAPARRAAKMNPVQALAR